MFKYDFIILYEHRRRELENAVLLAMMLEKKGYKVAIEYRRSVKLLFISADVILAPFLYDDGCIKEFVLHPFHHCKKIINMQYEQVFLKKEEEKLLYMPKGIAQKAVHISWGAYTTECYKKVGILQNHIYEIGHISMDLNMLKYRKAFLNKKLVAKHMSIPHNKKWFLFISSFSYVGLAKTEFERSKGQTFCAESFSEISYKSQPFILDFFERLAKEHPELEIIYRPHPHEDICSRLTELCNKYDNFKVVSDYSIRQWILISDYISTWCSTSLVDVLYAQKPCAVIRPIPFQEEFDYNIFRNQKIISRYEELEDFVNNPNSLYCVNPEMIRKYYCNDFDANTFEKMCNICVQVKKDDVYNYDYFKAVHHSILFLLKLYIYRIGLSFAEYVDFSNILPERYRTDARYIYKEMRNYKKEIAFYRKRFLEIIRNEEP